MVAPAGPGRRDASGWPAGSRIWRVGWLFGLQVHELNWIKAFRRQSPTAWLCGPSGIATFWSWLMLRVSDRGGSRSPIGRDHPDRPPSAANTTHPLSHRAARLPGHLDPGGRPGRTAPPRALGPGRGGHGRRRPQCVVRAGRLRLCVPRDVQGSNGSYEPVSRYAPDSVRWLVDGDQAVFEGDWSTSAGRSSSRRPRPGRRSGRARRPVRPYAVLLVPCWLTLGPAASSARSAPTGSSSTTCRSCRAAGAPAAHGAHQPGPGPAGRVRARPGRSTAAGRPAPGGRLAAAAVVVAGTLLVLQDYVTARTW